ncbi:MAG: saccharopine dehydrogenase NADP-binding domain-containing protein [Rhizobiaceae bacterium]|nr:saccharopine dehydrogenase NADP-binding domain-containing protein [Rhizobiaceae bacterium]
MTQLAGKKIAVFGAAGHTGRFVVAELLRRGASPVAIGRDRNRLNSAGFSEQHVELRELSAVAQLSLELVFNGADAVINCAGPFLDTARQVASAALRTGIHYLDLSAEQASTADIYEEFDAAAREAALVFLPATAFFGGFPDLLLSALVEEEPGITDVTIAIALDHWHPTEGTRLTGRRNVIPRLEISGGQLVPLPQPLEEAQWDFPDPFLRQNVVALPFSEVPVISQHLRLSRLRTYLTSNALADIRDPTTPPPAPADQTGASAQKFLVDIVGRSGSATRRLSASGQDIYAFTAPLVCEAVERILDGRIRAFGAQAPGAVFDAASFLKSLAIHGHVIRTEIVHDV